MDYGEYITLFTDARGDLAYIADMETHEMLFMTRAAMELVGLSGPEEYKGKKCYAILQGRDTPCEFCTNKHLAEGSMRYVWEQYNPVAKKWLRLENYLFELGGRRCRGEWALDISGEHKAVSSLKDRLDISDVLLKSIRTMALEQNVRMAINEFLKYICLYYKAERVCVFEADFENQQINNTFEWCADGVPSRMAEFQRQPLGPVKSWIDAMAKDPALNFGEPGQAGGGMEGVLEQRNVGSLLVAPIMRDGQFAGFLGVDNPGEFKDDPTLLRIWADFIAEEFKKLKLEQDIRQNQQVDRLTGLRNRESYLAALERLGRSEPAAMGILMMDLDGVKDVNERYGYSEGNRFICDCADILKGLGLQAYRLSGDEFVALVPGVSEQEFNRQEKRLRAALKKLLPNTVSVGAAYSASEQNVAALVSRADEFMYAEKQAYYRRAVEENRLLRAGTADEVLADIRAGGFLAYYQPQVELATGRVFGAEALVRKRGQDGAIIPPARFIPFYEAEGVVSHLDLYMLELACRHSQSWWERCGQRPNISSNFSRQTLMEPGVAELIRSAASGAGTPPESVSIEVTESMGKLAFDELLVLVQQLRGLGFCISLDDFGSSYSNLATLARMDFDVVKLDKSLVDNIGQDKKSTMIVKSVIGLCHETLACRVLAEGVETAEQARMLKGFGCDYAQGYYFAKPMPEQEFFELLAGGKSFEL